MLEKLKKFGWGYILIGALLITVGILFISAQNAYEILAIIMGCILAAVGIGFIIYALTDKRRGIKFGVRIAVSVIAIICGTVTMIVRTGAIEVIANVFFLLLIIDGAFKLQLSILSQRLSYWGWWLISASSVAVVISAFLLCKFTPENPATLATLSGIVIISDGILNILAAFFSSAITVEKGKTDLVSKEAEIPKIDTEAAAKDGDSAE